MCVCGVCLFISGAIIMRLSIYLALVSGVPPGLVVLGQQHLLVEQVHPLLPLDVQCGTHPQGRLIAWLGALMITYVNNTFVSRQKHVMASKISVHQKAKCNLKRKNSVFQGLFQCWWQVLRYASVTFDSINTLNVIHWYLILYCSQPQDKKQYFAAPFGWNF